MEPLKEVSNLANITAKNIPDDLYAKLNKSAKINRRSLNQEIIFCIENSLQDKVIVRDQFLEKARRIRKKTSGHPISNEELNLIKGINRL
jgi:antitoxin FitA